MEFQKGSLVWLCGIYECHKVVEVQVGHNSLIPTGWYLLSGRGICEASRDFHFCGQPYFEEWAEKRKPERYVRIGNGEKRLEFACLKTTSERSEEEKGLLRSLGVDPAEDSVCTCDCILPTPGAWHAGMCPCYLIP